MSQQTVVLIHGLVSSSLLLRPMARRLRNHGFTTKFWSYLSVRGSIEKHARSLIRFIDQQNSDSLHVVGHSMGAIISRRALLDMPTGRITRLVMLAPPNQGSHVASRLAPKLGAICPALTELSDHSESYVNQLGVPNVETGIVEAKSDFVVRSQSLALPGESNTPTIAFPGMHSQLLLRRDVADSVAKFLKNGQFE
ncbi:MAG: alpha/beta hydrolase [Planctomycetales bacterium]|nr:alpha/beta hydrolase [Planctomycetales bacterium]